MNIQPEKVLLVRMHIGRLTGKKVDIDNPRMFHRDTNQTCGLYIEVIEAIRIMKCYYRYVVLPDGREVRGAIFFRAKDFVEIADTQDVRLGIRKIQQDIDKISLHYIRMFSRNKVSLERIISSFI